MLVADRIVRMKPFSPAPGCPGPPSTARSPRARSRLGSRSASTAQDGRNPTSTAGLPIPPAGGHQWRRL